VRERETKEGDSTNRVTLKPGVNQLTISKLLLRWMASKAKGPEKSTPRRNAQGRASRNLSVGEMAVNMQHFAVLRNSQTF
jgi:hypothetical protein